MPEVNRHLEIGYDDWYIEKQKAKGRTVHQITSIEPHYGREIGLMKAGLKSCAVIHKQLWNEHWVKTCEENNWRYTLNNAGGDSYIAVQGEYWRIDTLDLIHRHAKLTKAWTDEYTVIFGRLLGYDQLDIDTFLDLLKRPKEEYEKFLDRRWRTTPFSWF